MILREAPREHLSWLSDRAKVDVTPWLRAMEAVDGDRVLAMIGFTDWSKGSCSMHVALDDSFAGKKGGLKLLPYAFDFVFNDCGLTVAIGTVRSDNPKALALDLNVGFREVFRGRDWCEPGVDLIYLEMRKDECRWLKGENHGR